MSFILDALRKSEAERQQNSSAEFAAVPSSPGTPPVPRWLWIGGLLLAVNLAVLLGLLLQQDDGPSQTTTTVRQHPPPDPQRRLQPSFEDQVSAAQQRPPGKQEQSTTVSPVQQERRTVRPVLISQDPSSIPPEDLYPSIHEMRASGFLDLPELHLDIHVFSAEAENRFVFINMVKLREGSRLDEGPVVVEITPDGVVLNYQGDVFLVPRK